MRTLAVSLVLALAGAAARGQQPPAPPRKPADLIVEGRVFTSDRAQPRAEAVAIAGRKIVAVGTRTEIAAWRGKETRVYLAHDRTVVPGFNDAHCHFTVAFGLDLGVDLSAARGLDEIRRILKREAAKLPPKEPLRGQGWHLADMPGGRYPTAAMLDEAVSDRPVYLTSEGPHAMWVNSAALREAGIEPGGSDPPATRIIRDAQGRATGCVLGRGTFFLFRSRGAMPSFDLEGVRRGLAEARRVGVTTVHDPVSPFVLKSIAEMYDAGELTLRFHVWGSLMRRFGGGAKAQKGAEKTFGREDWITFGALKGGVDGMPGLRTAALLKPYADDASTRGLPSTDLESLRKAVAAGHAGGCAVAIHSTGDAATRMVLDALGDEKSSFRDRIEHGFIIAPSDVARLAKADVVVSTQPSFIPRDLALHRYLDARLGPDRISHAFPLRSLLDAGIVLAFGTDFSLTPLNPMIGLYGAVARRTLAGQPEGGWTPDERISLAEAVRAYTWGSAHAEGAEARKGRLLPGQLADLVVLSRDIFELEPAGLLDVEADLTVVDGRVVYERGK